MDFHYYRCRYCRGVVDGWRRSLSNVASRNIQHLRLVNCSFGNILIRFSFGGLTNAWLSILINTIAPDVFVFGVDNTTTSALYRDTCHELAHATHFQQVGEEALDKALWWADVINYEVACGVLNGGSHPYDHPSIPKEGKVGITEMWAHAVGYIMLYEYWGKNTSSALYPKRGIYWFKPEIIWELYKVGLSLQDINKSMTSGIVTMQSFKEQLISDNSAYKSQINSIFN